jgi:hypothetical protein
MLRASPDQTGSEVIFTAQNIAEILVNIIGINLMYPASIIDFSIVHHLSFKILI